MANINQYKRLIVELTETWHWTAELIYKKLKKNHIFLGIGTVYRNLTELVEEWVLMKHHGLWDKLIYEKHKPAHGHLFCQNSWMIEDIDISMLDFNWIEVPPWFCLDEIQVTLAGHFDSTQAPYCKITWRILR
jgi:Fe2+ or Zn2+ uptake regulation protein